MSGGGKPAKATGGGLQSFPVPSAAADVDQDDVEEEIHRDEDVCIKVSQSPGFLCHIEATAAFRLPAKTLYKQLITHPDNAAIFRHMDRCSYRRVLKDDGKGRRQVRVAHEASWRFLLLHGTFTTRLLVSEDDQELTMAFELDPEGGSGGIMRRFHGRWRIRPHPADPEHASLSTLDQDLALGIYMPPPFDRILKRISCNQVKKIFEDVKREADNIHSGKPTLRPWEEVADKAFGDGAPPDEQPPAVPEDCPASTRPVLPEDCLASSSSTALPEGGRTSITTGAGEGMKAAAAAPAVPVAKAEDRHESAAWREDGPAALAL